MTCVGNLEQIVWQFKLRHRIFKECHDNIENLGHDSVFGLERTRFYWPRMHSDIKHYLQKVCHCLKHTPPQRNNVNLSIPTGQLPQFK